MVDQSDLKLRSRVAPSLFYKIDPPEANHNFRHLSAVCAADVHFSHFQFLHFEKYLAIKSTKKLEN
jgi:hypothetical protein